MNSRACNPWTARKFTEHLKESVDDCSQCRPDCHLASYVTAITSAEFRFSISHINLSQNMYLYLIVFPSPCTSRNLNLNSFCNLTDNTSLAKWKPAIQATYGNISELPDYIRGLSGPMRPVYPDGMAEEELITSLVKVLIHQVVVLGESHFHFRENTTMPLRRTLQL